MHDEPAREKAQLCPAPAQTRPVWFMLSFSSMCAAPVTRSNTLGFIVTQKVQRRYGVRLGWRVPLRSHRWFHAAKWSKKSHLGHRWYRLNGIFRFIWKPYIEDSLCHAPASTFTLRCETMGGIWNGGNGRGDRRSSGRCDGRGGSRCALSRHRRAAVAATKLRQHGRNRIRIARGTA